MVLEASDCYVSPLVLGIWCGKRPRKNWTSEKTEHCLMSLRRKLLTSG